MRGKPSHSMAASSNMRNIPAYAGKTHVKQHIDCFEEEHPRVCGENNKWPRPVRGLCGTSPRMRGKRNCLVVYRIRRRNIPAYAGKTDTIQGGCDAFQEHPRVCGENGFQPEGTVETAGTSPRMRGKHMLHATPNSSCRNIPAYAGKTTGPRGTPGHHSGTSPRMRGKLPDRGVHRATIPEHPRVCGENLILSTTLSVTPGTSPRMRGKPPLWFLSLNLMRNIPAYAGKTHKDTIRDLRLAEHPRVCGENLPVNPRLAAVAGTSPRMRGKHRDRNQCAA